MPSKPELPTYRGLPIPWVTRRDTERPPQEFSSAAIVRGLDVLTGQPTFTLEISDCSRDDEGWLWQPSPQAMGGKPEFKAVNAERHRRCMDEILCQVCGHSAVRTRGPVHESSWLVPVRDLDTRGILARQPPTCPDCIPVAQAMCPHLRKTDWPQVWVERTESYGVVGDVYNVAGEIIYQGIVQHHHPYAGMTLARQRVVLLRDWRRA